MKIKPSIEVVGLGLAVLFVGAYYLQSKLTGVTPGGLAAGIGTGAVSIGAGAVGGVAVGLGDQVGIPRTNETECQAAIREGRTWDASFACDAGTFLGDLFGWKK